MQKICNSELEEVARKNVQELEELTTMIRVCRMAADYEAEHRLAQDETVDWGGVFVCLARLTGEISDTVTVVQDLIVSSCAAEK